MPPRDGLGDVLGVGGEDRLAVGQQRVGDRRAAPRPCCRCRARAARARPRGRGRRDRRRCARPWARRIPARGWPAQSARGWPNTTSSSRCTAGAPPRWPSARRDVGGAELGDALGEDLAVAGRRSRPRRRRAKRPCTPVHADGQQRGAVLGQRAAARRRRRRCGRSRACRSAATACTPRRAARRRAKRVPTGSPSAAARSDAAPRAVGDHGGDAARRWPSRRRRPWSACRRSPSASRGAPTSSSSSRPVVAHLAHAARRRARRGSRV